MDECAAELDLIIKFADDTKGLKEINGPEDREKLQRALDKLERWAEKWGMKFNIPKCKIMHVGPHNPGYAYTMSGQQLVEVEEEKDIGVTVHRSGTATVTEKFSLPGQVGVQKIIHPVRQASSGVRVSGLEPVAKRGQRDSGESTEKSCWDDIRTDRYYIVHMRTNARK